MKKSLFVMTHVGSGWEQLKSVLEQNPRINCFCTGNKYDHPLNVHALTNLPHKRDNSAAVWADFIFLNKNFTMKRLCQYYRFIFWSRSYEDSRIEIEREYGPNAEAYYGFRMEGLKQYFGRCSRAIWNPDLEQDSFLSAIL